jgi:hypothetical protein
MGQRTSRVSSQSAILRRRRSIALYRSLRAVQSVMESLRRRLPSNSGNCDIASRDATDACGSISYTCASSA